jgi:hypothetical protein
MSIPRHYYNPTPEQRAQLMQTAQAIRIKLAIRRKVRAMVEKAFDEAAQGARA